MDKKECKATLDVVEEMPDEISNNSDGNGTVDNPKIKSIETTTKVDDLNDVRNGDGVETDPFIGPNEVEEDRTNATLSPTAPDASESKKEPSKKSCKEKCNCCQNKYVALICPPRGRLEKCLLVSTVTLLSFGTLWSIIGQDMLPGGNLFSLFIMLIAALFGGYLVRTIPKARFPPLLGMLIAGFMLRNISAINVAKHINKNWSSSLRSMALVVILLRSGLGLDIDALKKLKCTVIRLAFLPCVVEAVTVAVVAHFLLKMPWLWGLQLGFIIGAVSPAVVVPSMLELQLSGYGIEKGIPTLVMAASSCDDVLAISMFGVFLGVAFSTGNLAFNIFRGPIELIMGIVIGVVLGMVLWYLPGKGNNHSSRYRFVFLLGLGLFAVFGSNRAEFSGAGALAVLTLAAVAGFGWGEAGKEPIEKGLSLAWDFFQPLLFGLIGAEVKVEYLSQNLVGKGLGTLFIGLLLRLTVTYLVVFGNRLEVKERIFIAISWLPKATVQAAIGSIPLLTAEERGYAGKFQERVGREIVTLAVLVILVTAPLGAIGISTAGPRCLQRRRGRENTVDVATSTDDQPMIEIK